MTLFEKGVKVFTRRGGKPKMTGALTGAHHRCQMEGCLGYRLTVRWPDGHHTRPCTKGMTYSLKGWRIL